MVAIATLDPLTVAPAAGDVMLIQDGIGLGVAEGLGEGVAVGLGLAVAVREALGVDLGVGVGVSDTVGVGVRFCTVMLTLAVAISAL